MTDPTKSRPPAQAGQQPSALTRPGHLQLSGSRLPAPVMIDWGVGAGTLLREELSARGLSQAELASRTGLSAKHVNQVVQGVVPLTTETALLIERATGISAELLISIDATHQAQRGRAAARERLTNYRDWLSGFPLKTLVSQGIIDAAADDITQLEQLLAFFGVADPKAFERMYDAGALSFRRAQHLNVDVRATAVWLRLVERAAAEISCGPYNKLAFTALLQRLPELTREPAQVAFGQLQERCAEVGVAVVYTPEIHGARVTGATRWVGTDRPVIAVTGRNGTEDGLWFAFFHEAAHVTLHPRRRSVIDLGDDGDDQDGAESEANAFAARILLRGQDATALSGVKSHAQAQALAEAIRIDAGIVAGLISHSRGGSAWRNYRSLRRKLEL